MWAVVVPVIVTTERVCGRGCCWAQIWKLLAGQRPVFADLKQHDSVAFNYLESIAGCTEASFEATACPSGPPFFTFPGSDDRCAEELEGRCALPASA